LSKNNQKSILYDKQIGNYRSNNTKALAIG
jgi:hypothetical protein